MTHEPPHITPARSDRDIALARTLMVEFMDWMRDRYSERLWQIDQYYGADAWQAELDGLPGRYAPPSGDILLAFVDDAPAACVALQSLASNREPSARPDICEVNRMFVRPAFHGRGIASAMMKALMEVARDSGYRLMRLETGDLQPEAISLYRSLGFHEIPAWHTPPPGFEDVMVYMEIMLD